MGKVKIPMVYEKDAALRRKRFNDRKNGVIKKVKELGKLTGAKVLLLMQNTEKDDILCISSMDEDSVKKCLPNAGFKGKLEYELIPDPVENSHDNDAFIAAASDVNGYQGCPFGSSAHFISGFPSSASSPAWVSMPPIPPAHPYHAPVSCQDRAPYTAYLSNSNGISTVGTAVGQFQNHAPVYCQNRAPYTAYLSDSNGVSRLGTAVGQSQNHAPVYGQDRAPYTAYLSNSNGVSTVGTAVGQFHKMLVGTEQIRTFAEPPKSVGVAADCVTPAAEQKLDSNSEWLTKEVESANIVGGRAPISFEDADLNNTAYDNALTFTEEELEQLFKDLESTLPLDDEESSFSLGGF